MIRQDERSLAQGAFLRMKETLLKMGLETVSPRVVTVNVNAVYVP